MSTDYGPLAKWLGYALVGAIGVVAMRETHVDVDLWHEMALAEEAVALGYVPWDERFAFTPTVHPSVHHEWAAGFIGLGAAKLGPLGLVLLRYGVAALIALAMAAAAEIRGAKSWMWILLALLPATMMPWGFEAVRAQMYSLLFTALTLYALESDRQGGRGWIAWFLLVMLVWVNVHGGFVVGAGLLAVDTLEAFLRGQRPWHRLAVGAAVAGIVGLTPFLWEHYPYLWHALRMPRPEIVEWAPLWKAVPMHIVVVTGTLVALGVGAALWRGLRDAHGLAIFAITAFEAFSTTRLLLFFVLVWGILVPAWLSGTWLGRTLEKVLVERAKAVAIGLCVLVPLVLLAAIPSRGWHVTVLGGPAPADVEQRYYPVGPVDYLLRHPRPTRVLTDYDWGAYVMYRLGPQVKISLDSRYEVAYPQRTMDDVRAIYFQRDGWEQKLEAFDPDAVIVPRGTGLADDLVATPGWNLAYQDAAWVLVVRHGGVVLEEGKVREGAWP